MGRRRGDTISVHVGSVEVYADDILDDLTTEELQEELRSRIEKGDANAVKAGKLIGDDIRDWERLQDHIAAGETRDALFLLKQLRPSLRTPEATVRFIEARRAH